MFIMWQFLLAAAAAAGSTGLVTKHLFNAHTSRCEGDRSKKEKNPFDDDVKYQSPVLSNTVNESGYETNCEKQDGIFRFSSPESDGKSWSKNVKKRRVGDTKVKNNEKRFGGVEVSKRRVAVCLKKRKIAKNVASKCGSCSSKDSSVFSWGLGIGIMYMMSAGKAEISKLNTAMDETAKVVQELNSELKRRKSIQNVRVLSSANEVTEHPEKISNNQAQQVLIKSRTGDRDLNDVKVLGVSLVDDGDCTSSVLTEDRDAEVVEMDQLEAELETELQKLPWFMTEASCHEDMKLNLHETSDCYQSNGVSPAVLDQKLSRLLIEQQENQIVDLESELNSTQSKLREKEAELEALKDCVKRLTQFSLSTSPDDETKAQEEQDCNSKWNCSNEVELESRPVVGMKRHVDTSLCSYYVNKIMSQEMNVI